MGNLINPSVFNGETIPLINKPVPNVNPEKKDKTTSAVLVPFSVLLGVDWVCDPDPYFRPRKTLGRTSW
jgi:hypothetical protein